MDILGSYEEGHKMKAISDIVSVGIAFWTFVENVLNCSIHIH